MLKKPENADLFLMVIIFSYFHSHNKIVASKQIYQKTDSDLFRVLGY